MYAAAPAKPEARLATVGAPSSEKRSPPRRQNARHVIYKSTALQRTAPALVAAAPPAAISSSLAIKHCAATAESARDGFKLAKCGPEIDIGEGDDEATNAKKYERRLLMNRHSAAASRVRREAYTKALEVQVVEQEANLAAVMRQLEMERARVHRLLSEVERGSDLEESDLESDHQAAEQEYLQQPPAEDAVAATHEEPAVVEVNRARQPPESDLHVADVAPNVPLRPVLESQTEDNTAPVVVAPPSQPTSLLPTLDHAPIQQHLSPKAEDFLFPDVQIPVPAELVPLCPDDKLLESFLYSPPEEAKDTQDLAALDFL